MNKIINIDQATYDKLCQLTHAYIDEDGMEVNNPAPLEVPEGFKRPATLLEQIRRVLRTEVSRQAAAQDMESWEEANDFAVEDEFDIEEPMSPYTEMVPEAPADEPVVTDETEPVVPRETTAEPVESSS